MLIFKSIATFNIRELFIMATRETQDLILNTSLSLFNEHGTRAISTNRIADECQLSRGNVHYHFRTKKEIVQTLFQKIDKEMEESWYDDHSQPTMKQMHFMFTRQIKLIWQYRFLFRELNSLLQNDARFKILFMNNRKRRYKEVSWFFEELVKTGLIIKPKPPVPMDSLLTASWLITDQWLAHLDLHDHSVNEQSIGEGFELIMHIFDPYFTDEAKQEYRKIEIEKTL
jgi:AcrR family transcriptional regulator